MKNLWSAMINSLLTDRGAGDGYILTDGDKTAIANKVYDMVDTYELSDEEKLEIVNEVLSQMPATGSGEKKAELINTVTATDGSRLIVCNRDMNGEPFQLEKVYFFVRYKPSSQSTDSAGIYSLATLLPDIEFPLDYTYRMNYAASGALKTAETYSCFGIEMGAIENETEDMGRLVCLRGTPSIVTSSFKDIPAGCDGICQVGVMTSSDKALFGPGSTMKIYGVRV